MQPLGQNRMFDSGLTAATFAMTVQGGWGGGGGIVIPTTSTPSASLQRCDLFKIFSAPSYSLFLHCQEKNTYIERDCKLSEGGSHENKRPIAISLVADFFPCQF